MTSWKTSLGGALAATGTFLWGAPVALKAMEMPVDAGLAKWCIIIGLVASAGGVFFMGLFGRDNNVTSEDVKAAAAKKDEVPPFRPPVWIIGALIGVMLGSSGCLVPRGSIAPGADPLVVQAEALAETAGDSMNAFVQWEFRNRAGVHPDVTAAADLVREFGPQYLRDLKAATRLYKANRNVPNADATRAAIATLQSLLEQARNYYQPKATI